MHEAEKSRSVYAENAKGIPFHVRYINRFSVFSFNKLIYNVKK